MSDTETPDAAEVDDAAEEPVVSAPYGAIAASSSRGQVVLHVGREGYLDTISTARADGFVLCVDITAVDYANHLDRALPASIEGERFEVVVNLYDPVERRRVRIRAQVPESDPTIASIYSLYPGVDAPEREVYDMFGITFEGHPDPTRILMPEDWDGHPLRKDVSQGRIPVQFKSATNHR
ncbi:MAG: NADH-quinone oxidoreductase subunit C [Actinomycetota bacterium]